MFFKIGVLKNFALQFIKKRLQHRCFLVNTAKYLRTAYIITIVFYVAFVLFCSCFLFALFCLCCYFFHCLCFLCLFSKICIQVYLKVQKISKTYLEPSRTSAMELLAVNYFRKKASSQVFEWVLNIPVDPSESHSLHLKTTFGHSL